MTCTPSKVPFLKKKHLHPGLFVAAIGADSPLKQELESDVLTASMVVVDLLAQCAEVGELHHALNAGMSRSAVYAELSEIIVGTKPGRTSRDQIITLDATGTALQDAAAAATAFNRATLTGVGTVFDFFSRVESWR